MREPTLVGGIPLVTTVNPGPPATKLPEISKGVFGEIGVELLPAEIDAELVARLPLPPVLLKLTPPPPLDNVYSTKGKTTILALAKETPLLL